MEDDGQPDWAMMPDRLARRIAAGLSGNYSADTSAEHFTQHVQRALTLALPIIIGRITLLDGATSLSGFGAVAAALQCSVQCLIVWAVISASVRSRNSARIALLHATLAAHRYPRATALGAFLHGCGRLLTLVMMQLLVLMRATIWATNPAVGPLWACASLATCSVSLGAVVDVMFTAGRWVDASNRAVRGMRQRIEAALVADRKANGDSSGAAHGTTKSGLGRPRYVRRVSFFNTTEGKHSSVDSAERIDVETAEVFTRFLFQDAFEGACDVVATMNSILSGPMTALMFGFFLVIVLMVMFMQTAPSSAEKNVFVGFAMLMSVMLVFLLKWLASVGDVFNEVQTDLRSPALFLPIAHVLDRDEPPLSEAARYALDHAEMGFAVYNVTMTTRNVIYLFSSILLYVVVSSPF
jgi:hypothetical protein